MCNVITLQETTSFQILYFGKKTQHTQNASKAFDQCNYLLLFTKLIDIYCDSIYC